jgi:hypothetical protein
MIKKYPVTLFFLTVITIYALLSLNNIVKPINDSIGFALFLVVCTTVSAESALR